MFCNVSCRIVLGKNLPHRSNHVTEQSNTRKQAVLAIRRLVFLATTMNNSTHVGWTYAEALRGKPRQTSTVSKKGELDTIQFCGSRVVSYLFIFVIQKFAVTSDYRCHDCKVYSGTSAGIFSGRSKKE